ncbi:hypothetical protein EAG_07406 [Camponotus floridanus]|uniref:Uncharacterized protein n=1 Tax=Camponotus floridanus TaxID=104421 RepID=E2ASG2_CAMFO|nr:hypothetical protein EAG_07406 [Camponotus floridanus]
MRRKRKSWGDYDRYKEIRRYFVAMGDTVSCHDLTFDGRVSALVRPLFTTAIWKSRVPLLLVTEASQVTTGTNFIVSLLYTNSNTRSTAPFPAHKLHRRRKTADRRYSSGGRLSAGAAREKWPETSLTLGISAWN